MTGFRMFRFEVWQNDLMVAAVESDRRDGALREVAHYAMVRSGQASIYEKRGQSRRLVKDTELVGMGL